MQIFKEFTQKKIIKNFLCWSDNSVIKCRHFKIIFCGICECLCVYDWCMNVHQSIQVISLLLSSMLFRTRHRLLWLASELLGLICLHLPDLGWQKYTAALVYAGVLSSGPQACIASPLSIVPSTQTPYV